MARICVIGAWHQATVMAACFAELGHEVTGVWPDPALIASLESAHPPLYEPGLAQLMREQLAAGRLRYTPDFRVALRGAEFVFLAIDTPVAEDDSPETGVVIEMARRAAKALAGGVVLCVSAQVPVGTTERIAELMNEVVDDGSVVAAYVPEFLRLGTALETFRRADRIVIGCNDADVAQRIAALYTGLDLPIVITQVRSAEVAKHACNAFLATSISFINEVANLCESTGARIDDVSRIMKMDRRIGEHAFLSAGAGFAGGTLGRDVRALQQLGVATRQPTHLLDGVVRVNTERAAAVTARLERELGGLAGARIGILGLTYKPGTSTLRRSLALELIALLAARGADVRACDPLADFAEAPDLPDFAMCDDAKSAAEGADALVLMTGWPALRDLDLADIARRMRRPVLLDTRSFFEPDAVAQAGLVHLRMGHGQSRLEAEALSAGITA